MCRYYNQSWRNLHEFKWINAITIDSYYPQEGLSNLDVLAIIKKVLSFTGRSYSYIHFKNDPCNLTSSCPSLNSRFRNILLKKQSIAEELGCSRLLLHEHDSNFIIKIIYKSDFLNNLYIKCKNWINDYTTKQSFKDSFDDYPNTKEKENFWKFLSNNSLRSDISISSIYKKIINKKDPSSQIELFENYFFNFRNPLLAQIIQKMFFRPLNIKDPLHKAVCILILNHALKIKEYANKDRVLSNDELKKIRQQYFQGKMKKIKQWKIFPIENFIISQMPEDKIVHLITNDFFSLFTEIDSTVFDQLVDNALFYLQFNDLNEYQKETNDTLHSLLTQILDQDLSWSAYFLPKVKSSGTELIKWYLCYWYISQYDDFFISFKKSFW